jgi:hypothetical protein
MYMRREIQGEISHVAVSQIAKQPKQLATFTEKRFTFLYLKQAKVLLKSSY